MAVTITAEDVTGYGITAPPPVIDGLIILMAQADACLDHNKVPDDVQRTLKLYAIGHMAALTSGGQIRSQSAPNGASRSFAVPTGVGLASSTWGSLLKSLDKWGCVTGLLENDQSKPMLLSIGPGSRRLRNVSNG
ncbi:DUF7370 family protein [Vreelandella populi]|uniref:Uncharacterized protein n=1 Tax=Vreelandella populi TaxID=2498858 RepID=A0A3S1E9Q9_9GAMM|nr:hypothetical protein [Halomonas populi]RUR48797.1 hypothetical protein ELY37_02805 [Halomonas populi]